MTFSEAHVAAMHWKNEVRPRITAEVDGRKVDLLYDTGAQSSCLTKATVSQLFPHKKLQTTASRCQAAGNMDLGVVEEAHFEVRVKGKTLTQVFIICNMQAQRQHHGHRPGQRCLMTPEPDDCSLLHQLTTHWTHTAESYCLLPRRPSFRLNSLANRMKLPPTWPQSTTPEPSSLWEGQPWSTSPRTNSVKSQSSVLHLLTFIWTEETSLVPLKPWSNTARKCTQWKPFW